MKAKKILGATSLTAAALCAAFALGQPPKAVLTASELGIEDLGLDLDDLSIEVTEETSADVDNDAAALKQVVDAGTEAAPAVEEIAVEEVAPVVEAVTETVAEAAPAVEEVAVEEVAPVVEAVTETVAEAAPAVEEIAVEEVAPVVEAVTETVVEAVPVVEEVAVEEVAPIVEAVTETVAEAAPVVEEVAVSLEDVATAVETPAAEEVVVAETVPAVEEVSVVETETPAVEEVVVPESVVSAIDDILGDVAEVDSAERVAEPVETVEEEIVEVAEPVETPAPATVSVAVPEETAVAAVVEETDPAEAPVVYTEEEKAISELATIEESRRKLLIQHGLDCIRQGEDNLSIGNWARAVELFNDAVHYLPDLDSTHQDIEKARAGIGEAYYRIALDQLDRRSYEEAEKSCREARAYQHPAAEDLMRQIREYQTNPPLPPVVERLPRSKQKDYIEGRRDIKERLTIAREYMNVGEYDDARAALELILRDHPWNAEALKQLRRLNMLVRKFVTLEQAFNREDMINEVTKAWSPSTWAINYTKGDVHVSSSDTNAGAAGAELTSEMRIREKMSRITIPEIDFRQANIVDVVGFLGDASREYDDPEVPPDERGVNFVLDLGEGAAVENAAPAVSDDPWGAPAETVAENNTGISPITMKTRFVSLLGLLDMIVDMSGLKYRIQGNVVMIMPKNKAEGELIHRMYNVLPSIGERINTLGASKGAGSGDSGDPFQIDAGTTETTTDWKAFFAKLGVNWPDDSSVTYMPSIGKLVVKNTATNLATLEQVLGALNVTPFQVEIEVRFVEVAQKDLNSLGLEWILNDDWEMFENNGDSHLHPASRRRISMSKGSINSGFNYLSNNANIAVNAGSAVADNIATFSSILTNPELSLVLHALSNRSNTDLLSAPKVVAMNGSQATIKTVTEYIYPTEYDVEMLESSDSDSDTSTYTGAVVEPQTFVTREVGVILQVTPRVSSDGTRIGLDLTPSVVSEPTWKNYGSTYPSAVSNGTDLLGNPTYKTEYVQLMMEQPFFPVRSLATSVEIYNGSTVVMGGMIREERYTEEDKIPILGDIPLLGRLFRYSYDQSDKKNLLIFVTARLVDPAGRIVNSNSEALVNSVSE